MAVSKQPALQRILESLVDGPSPSIADAQIGAYWTAVVSRRCGLASTPHTEHGTPDSSLVLPSKAEVVGKPALEIACWALGQDGKRDNVKGAIGMAAINSLLEPDLERCQEVNARELLLSRAAGRNLVMVGHFPFTDDLRRVAGQLAVLELRQRPGDLPADQAEVVLPLADVIGITAVTLINGTFDTLMAWRRPSAYVVLLGGTAPLSPILFDCGVDAIAGTIVDDATLVMQDIAAGATFRQMRGKHPVLMLRD